MTELSDQIIKIIMQNGMNYSHYLVGLKTQKQNDGNEEKIHYKFFRTTAKPFFLSLQ